MREINHRAKNMLSVVDSIAHQTATRNPEGFIERFSERIQALFRQSGPARPQRMEWGGDRGPGSRPARALRRSHWLAYHRARPQASLEPGFRASHRARAPTNSPPTRGKIRERCRRMERVGVDRQLGESDGDALTMSWTEREGPPVSAPKAARVRHHRHASDDGAQWWRGMVNLDYAAVRPHLALDLPRPRTRWESWGA